MSVKEWVEHLRAQTPTRTNKRGNVIHDYHHNADRYMIDFADDFTAEGWQQFDTDQDAHYYGFWVNPSKLLTMSYAEGDWHLVECPDKEHYNAEIRDAIEFHGEGFILKAYGDDGCTILRQDRSQFIIT